ncbi:hypothetical protein BGX27_009171 [Mortierella sp. AM989]|nr:hypothetical protein BGX27_009171 [Mortierella sp. AM989]
MKATTPGSPHSPEDSSMDDVVDTSPSRGSLHHQHHHYASSQEYQPTSPAKRNSTIPGNAYPPADYSNVYPNNNNSNVSSTNLLNGLSHHPDDQSSHPQLQHFQDHRDSYQGYANHNDHSNGQYLQDHPARHHHPGAPNTPSPPLPSAADTFQGRPLPPIEPSHPLHTYMSNSRRGSIADPEYQNHSNTNGGSDLHRRASTTAEISGYYNSAPRDSRDPALAESNRHYTNSSSSATSTSTESTPYHPQTPNSPLHLRQKAAVAAEHASGRRESLPSIYSSAGPLGQLLAQEPQRRHSIAHSELLIGGNSGTGGPLKRKTSGTPLSQMHSSVDGTNSTMDHPAKRRDSIPDAAMGYPNHHHHQHPHHHHPYPYPPRNSYSAPSSPPRRGSIAPATGTTVPTLSLQPAAEIKSGPSGMEHPVSMPAVTVRPHFPLHQPRRPSLLSSEAGSRRSSIVDLHHTHGPQPHHLSHSPYSQQQQQQQQDYDQRMNMDMEKMHLSNQAPGEPQYQHQHRGSLQGPPVTAPPPSASSQGNSHLYPGYPSTYPADGSGKGETPYSRSPELRVSHKLAERKRRKEMKELFDELRDSLPVDRSLKTSKWEILSKAVDYIAQIKTDQDELIKEVEGLRQEVSRLKQ